MTPSGTYRDFPAERLRYLYESVRLGTMRAASDFLDMAPSSISRQITALEKEIGIELIEKNRHRVLLTPAGERLIEYYRDRLAQQEALVTDLDDLKGLRTGHLRIAVGTGLMRVVIARAVAEYTARLPGVRIDVVSAPSRAVISMVRDDMAHFGVVMDAPIDPRVWSRSGFPEPNYLIVAPHHSMASASKIDIRDLVNQPLILPEGGFRIRDVLSEFEANHGLFLDTRITASSVQFIADVTSAGTVATIMPLGCVSDYVEAGRLLALPISNPELNTGRVNIVTRVGRRLSSAAIALLDLLERQMKNRSRPERRPTV
ncbi:LysR family transcriptional regulator [Mesorhizobium sp. B1-1-9]|uniref:LysR family transcriptional regulator n=1 Tax=Mesorhizobium sp. B1-1-9 TaxID=2589975 RepID=UPI001128C205|nr:LysR family transcriptional regulator [Mesorhizobium sp. B1-1-9]TPN51639.1 LysR family transcriptional regulator [Mesorhizobium sp. B1-1-9]